MDKFISIRQVVLNVLNAHPMNICVRQNSSTVIFGANNGERGKTLLFKLDDVVLQTLHNRLKCNVSVRPGGWRGGPGADLRCDTDRELPVDDEAECRGGEHGEN